MRSPNLRFVTAKVPAKVCRRSRKQKYSQASHMKPSRAILELLLIGTGELVRVIFGSSYELGLSSLL